MSALPGSVQACGLPLPLNTRQDSRHIVCWTPSVLKNIETKLASSVYIGMKHLTDEFDAGRLIGVLFLEVHHQTKGSILKGRIGRANDNRIPIDALEGETAACRTSARTMS